MKHPRCRRFTWVILLTGLIGVVFAEALQAAEPTPNIPLRRVLLVDAGPDGHPPATHEFSAGQQILATLLSTFSTVQIERATAGENWPADSAPLEQADCVVLYLSQGAHWATADPRRYEALTRLAARGAGIVALHWATGAKPAETIGPFVALLGGCHGGPDRKYAVLETEVRIGATEHPITRGLASLRIRDEFYYQLKWALPTGTTPVGQRYTSAATPPAESHITSLLEATIDDQPRTVAWAWQRPDGGRSFGFTGLHFHDNWRREEYRRLVVQAVLWSAGLPVPDRGCDVKLPEEAFRLPTATPAP